MAHRVAFEFHHKRPIEDGKILLHSCDNRKCCNPNHLREGTHKDNSDDKFARGRFVRMCKESNGNSKLTSDQIQIIRHRYKTERISQEKLGKEYGVSQHAISKIVRGVAWLTEATEV